MKKGKIKRERLKRRNDAGLTRRTPRFEKRKTLVRRIDFDALININDKTTPERRWAERFNSGERAA